ncbi:DNA-directed RNA polymerase I subunit RPA1 [Ophiocordyceps camponoti-floridani]|uniref:DNA-directed RNA polymerase subunit n=1 Tax=Ophiocordyceps camponoti-floridani TaxID=2030778 RepID=A0A8H4Q6L5_9HYPO|nr:DNA-directed RNA polymerase I subunit RPA1 [Ophiocordyceps camponoti-floridani]
MNISQPVPSELDSVDFTFLSTDEIHAISVKRIENETTLDNLLNPSPGGLYDPALGSWGDYLCSSCNLNRAACPGHPGHIGLPVPVYHPVFLHQAFHLLRSIGLQLAVNGLIDNSKTPKPQDPTKKIEDGIKQTLEKKEGLFRKNMMGKRVNFAARSVISPDPNIETNEIGVPPVFAEKLTYPEPVTSHNFAEMQMAVINGPDKWPGAFAIENEHGQVVSLRHKSLDDRSSLANQLLAATNSNTAKTNNKKVYRHLTNGDVVLMNRQPTLHKPSIMGHRVRVLSSEKTLRMHYANCNTYNADFDGDEMNLHFPQNEAARAEALQIADTDHQYLSSTAGKPLRGLIQDHISLAVAMCSRDTFISRGDYQQLIYAALRPESGHIAGDQLQLLPAAIIKPTPRWTGKQVFSTILLNIRPSGCGGLSMLGATQIKAEQWGAKSEEGSVLFQDGYLVTGILDKSQIGSSSGGLVHAIHEVYGPAWAGKLLSSLSRMLTRYLHMRAFSCGIDDLRLTKEGEVARRQALRAADEVGLGVASTYVSLEKHDDPSGSSLLHRLEEVFRDDVKQKGLDLLMNRGATDITDAVLKVCIPNRLEKPFPRNQMQTMTSSGAKGSRVNASLITCNLGQQVLEGRRVPLMVSGKSLPCFKPFETSLRAGGYVVNRFLTGIRPQEYYFHHMAGREGLIDTAVKTSSSGYLQRCVIKGMEGLTVAYDNSVRDSDGSLIQFLYGEDGLEVTKTKYLFDFGFVLQNFQSQQAQLSRDLEDSRSLGDKQSQFTRYMKSAIKHASDRDGKDPLVSKVNPAANAFATSESFFESMTQYLTDNADGLVKQKEEKSNQASSGGVVARSTAQRLFAIKYLKSLTEPGEAVGVIAGQSVGEPSTQMTLNTFHLAGHSAKNVTLGIPRLREILMTASRTINTPSMTLYPVNELPMAKFEEFVKSISVLRLDCVVDRVDVEERYGRGTKYEMAKLYRVRITFFSSSEYSETYAVTATNVMDTVEQRLLPMVCSLMKKEIKTREVKNTGKPPEIEVMTGYVGIAPPSAPDDELDATEAREKQNRTQAVSYGPNDDEDDVVQQRNEREAMSSEDEDDDSDDDAFRNRNEGSVVDESQDEADDDAALDRLTEKAAMDMIDLENRHKEVSDDSLPAWEGAPDQSKSIMESIDENGSSVLAGSRSERILQSHDEVTYFESDKKGGEWCSVTLEYDFDIPKVLMLDIVRESIRKTVIRRIPGVGSCSLEVSNNGERMLHAAGVNLRAMQEYNDIIDMRRIQTNDIGAMLDVYGVEACRGNILRELTTVFESHGIKVDNRHLNLIADYMTRSGGFTSFDRRGLEGNVSPFTKMSFETTIAFLKDAVMNGDRDDLVTPSSRLVMGRLGRAGTGSFDIVTRLPMYLSLAAESVAIIL